MGWSGNRRLNTRNKYGAQKTIVDGLTFASKKEARRYGELLLLQKAGEITDVQVHPRWALHAWQLAPEAPVRIGFYTADFSYRPTTRCGLVVEDVKSTATRTEAYRLRKKLMKANYGIDIQEV